MIIKEYRFRTHASVRFVLRKGKPLYSKTFKICHLPNRGANYRLAVVVSKKVSKKAVIRNRIRRRIYELLRKRYATKNPASADSCYSSQSRLGELFR